MGIISVEHGGNSLRSRFFPPAAKLCSHCKTAPALLFCRTDAAFLCICCDSKVHDDDKKILHERVWICEVCEQSPAAVTCKADAAALCAACDGDIHSANPLASRHERVPVIPFYDLAETVVMNSASVACMIGEQGRDDDAWVSAGEMKPMELLFHETEPDHFLDFDSYHHPYNDIIVPVQAPANPVAHDFLPENPFHISAYNTTTTPSLSHSVSSSSIEYNVVPESETSYSFTRVVSGSESHVVGSLTDREARVLRYREKRKNRKFEKTIRYASRKAYAETRPRIKGRFAKRTSTDSDATADLIFSLGADAGYGVVPSF